MKAQTNKGKRVKYRVYHYYAENNRYDHIDLPTKERALAHYRKSRSAKEIYEIVGTRRGRQINPRTGGYMH